MVNWSNLFICVWLYINVHVKNNKKYTKLIFIPKGAGHVIHDGGVATLGHVTHETSQLTQYYDAILTSTSQRRFDVIMTSLRRAYVQRPWKALFFINQQQICRGLVQSAASNLICDQRNVRVVPLSMNKESKNVCIFLLILYLVCIFCLLGFSTLRWHIKLNMMTSSNGNIFLVTGHLCGEFIGLRWIPLTNAGDPELWCFLWYVSK